MTLFFVPCISAKGKEKEKAVLGGISWTAIPLMRKQRALKKRSRKSSCEKEIEDIGKFHKNSGEITEHNP